MELQAFVLGNTGFPSTLMILAYSFVLRFQLCGLSELGGYIARLRAAHRRGQQSRTLLDVPFEQFWERPVSEVSAMLCAPAVDVPELTAGVVLPRKPVLADSR